MGEARRRQHSREVFLQHNPRCCYCGKPSETVDHCPPRAVFLERKWPETYEFPACNKCNSQGRLDEQTIAALTRIVFTGERSPEAEKEWVKLLAGLANNQPDVLAEWQHVGPAEAKRSYRNLFGPAGDALRHQGWGSLALGPLSKGAISRFVVKLAQALYYRHCNEIFEGDIIFRHVTMLSRDFTPARWDEIIKIAPLIAEPVRSTKSLSDQFVYRFNYNPELGALYAVVGFNSQMNFQIIATREDLADRIRKNRPPELEDAEFPVYTVRLFGSEDQRSVAGDDGAPAVSS